MEIRKMYIADGADGGGIGGGFTGFNQEEAASQIS